MDHSIYKHYKGLLIETARDEKRHNPKDKARVRQVLNDSLDSYIRGLENHYLLKGKITEKQCELYKNWLTNLVCRLHP